MTSKLNKEQTAAVTAVKKGKNIFLTGAGGTGKSHTIRAIIGWSISAGVRVAVTAMTGCAALLLNNDSPIKAKTLHSWAGVGLAKGLPHELAESVKRNKYAARRWANVQLLIVDEVSMMTPGFLEKLDMVARRVRKNQSEKRFGGLQIVFAGDFCQLPPVGSTSAFLFESPLWPSLIDEIHNLSQIVRQSDPVFQQILTEARMGFLSPASLASLESRKGLDWQSNEIKPTLLFTRNMDVDKINRVNMEALDGERRTYEVKTVHMDLRSAKISTSPADQAVQAALTKLDADAPYEPLLELCVGAQVMLLTNMDQEHGLVNGSRGVVTGYSPGGLPLVRFLNQRDPVLIDRANWWLQNDNDTDPVSIGRAQIPLRIAYAITIHKSQGATLDSALVDIGPNTFEYGQAYVALSRCRSLEGLYIWKLSPHMILCHPVVRKFYEEMAALPLPEEENTEIQDPWALNRLSQAWQTIIEPRIHGITALLEGELDSLSPRPEDVFAALRACPDLAAIKVVILGQDPYPTAGVAHGLAFSIQTSKRSMDDVHGIVPSIQTSEKLPASLQNIYKELTSDLGCPTPTNGCLQGWADQGILLLNDVLTVQIGKPLSHSGRGWEALTAELLAAVLKATDHLVIVAWGRTAQKKLEHPSVKPLIAKHSVLSAPHPSPLSAHTGFYGSKPFSKTNAALVAHGQEAIDWTSGF